jgi:hypothetical protein
MTWRESNSPRISALAAAEVYFPDQASKIQQLFQMNEAFSSMCEDLVAAVEALTHVGRLPDNVREIRRQEYEGLVDALVGEIGEALSKSNVVILQRPGKANPKSRGI